MSTLSVVECATGPARWGSEIARLRRRYQVLAASRATPPQRAEIAHVSVKLAELLHLMISERKDERTVAAIPVLTSWLAGRIDLLEARARTGPMRVSRV
jgi:hypothetical protein